MQGFLFFNAIWYVLPSIILGLIIGRMIGGNKGYTVFERLALAIILGTVGGLIVSFIVGTQVEINTQYVLLGIASFLTATFFGAATNWAEPPPPDPKRHIIYDFDDDDEAFDREIEEALGGSN